jgi:hypothetical protein
MRKTAFTEEQIAYTLRQSALGGMPWSIEEGCRNVIAGCRSHAAG